MSLKGTQFQNKLFSILPGGIKSIFTSNQFKIIQCCLFYGPMCGNQKSLWLPLVGFLKSSCVVRSVCLFDSVAVLIYCLPAWNAHPDTSPGARYWFRKCVCSLGNPAAQNQRITAPQSCMRHTHTLHLLQTFADHHRCQTLKIYSVRWEFAAYCKNRRLWPT